ncbi:hypothetical protein B5X24_HaOG200556 [Helicoverpa armigera]|uniref:Lipase domain-containing protein n=1 Tax=Helicoverpa armigera TaxID=29058 RepID=A0A2W1BL36_HELAM|nr:hypothetical protein B5X24_HaOG200556 [Helicoverpa armigera]
MKIVVILMLVVCVEADTGQPAGFMADCPGMNRTTVLSEATKRSLSVVVVYPTSGFLGHREVRCKLSTEGAACAAKHLDFKKRKTQVMISGYLDGSFSPIVRSFIAMYLKLGRNVIVLEIFPILVRTYPIAARITKPLGELLGEFLASLTFQGLSPRRLELVGGSLGAHIASFAADTYRQLTGRRPARITGLDPAGPCFRNVPATARLHADAATHVDVLHTNIDGFGIAQPLGHVDFYANGGEFQTSIKGDFIMPCFQLCSHIRSAFYWLLAYSNPDKFVAVQCDSVANARIGDCYNGTIRTNVLGPRTNFSKTGVFYLPTEATAPYHLGLSGLKKRKFGVNDYLMTPAPDEDMTI